MKIMTLTLSPAIDVTYVSDEPVTIGLNRAKAFCMAAGGKGINVSRAVLAAADAVGDREIADSLVTVAPVGGASGASFGAMLEEEGIALTKIGIDAPLRINVSVVPDRGEDTEINAPGAQMTVDDLRKTENLILSKIEKNDVVCICGSCPKGVSKSYPAQLCEKIKEKGGVCVVDCDGEALRTAVSADRKPDYIKPNADELQKLCEDLAIEEESAQKNAEAVCRYTNGRTTVVTTLGGDGSMITYAEKDEIKTYQAPAQRVKPNRIKGAGDTFLGAYLYYHFRKNTPQNQSLVKAADAATKYVRG